MSYRFKYIQAQYNNRPDTRPGGVAEVRANDTKRPGGASSGTPDGTSRAPRTPRRSGGMRGKK